MTKFTGYIGTYTKKTSKGIYSFVLDTEAKKITDVSLVAEIENPTYLTVTIDNQHLFAVGKEGSLGGVSAYSIHSDGSLALINSEYSEGASPCHVSVNADKTLVLSANYHKGTAESYPVHTDGSLSSAASIIEHTGTGPNPARQEKPHMHFAGFSPNDQYAVSVDLGTDRVDTYKLVDGKLEEVSSLSVKPGSGPRHIAFHPNGKFAYVMTELSNEVIALSFNAETGAFEELQYISTLPIDFTENSQGSAIHLSSDGNYVYAGNRGHNSIAIFQVNGETGQLTFIDRTSTEGNWPRDFVLDPTEQFLLASNEQSDTLTLFERDTVTGKLTLLQSEIEAPEPVCVKFLNN
ncbi:lactonase family protein [Niallia sp. FSL W8-0951]|uniref:lactonase family protein n=1 Tax=Niallia TaxID=2837506 RepID=UPI001560274C|nr:lactonase family protein [Niallia circulans]MED5101296.1 lactonase family protein [Niallia circulans]NRG30945.1 lactonase family protein [Niallia circulans]